MDYPYLAVVFTIGLLCISGSILYYFAYGMMWLAEKAIWVNICYAVVGVFVVVVTGGKGWSVLVFLLIPSAISLLNFPRNGLKIKYDVFGIAFLVLILFGLWPQMMNFWNGLGVVVAKSAAVLPEARFHFLRSVFFLLRFFRNIYPGVLVAIVMLAFSNAYISKKHSYTVWQRMFRTFDHWRMWLMMVPLAIYSVFEFIVYIAKIESIVMEGIKIGLISIFLYEAVIYVIFGVLNVVSAFWKSHKIPSFPVIVGMVMIMILSGSLFPIPLLFVLGIGISDFWMDYQQRERRNVTRDSD